jgi:hypothetical protein
VFTVSSGLTLAGESGSQKISAFPEQITAPQSKLVVSAPLGNYNSVFASDQHRGKPDANPSRTLVESVEFKSLWINQNPSRVKNAHISNDKSQGGAYQFAILLKSFSNVLVERMRFEPATGVNTIALGGPKSQGAIINSNYFRFINGNPDHKDYDNSSVYIDSKNQEVKNNHFVSRPEEGARAAIEAHSGPALVTENRSWGFMTGVNITSTSPGNNINDEDENPNAFENNITVSHNEFFGTITGIKLWSFAKRTDRLIQRRLYGVTIVENRVKMANRSELKRRMDAGRPIPGIVCAICFTREAMVKDFKDGNFENIAITQNEITYPNESAVYSMPNNTNLNPDQKNKPPIRLELSAAFLMRPKSQLKNIRIERNSIKNAPSYLMILGGGEIPTPSSIGSSDIRFLSNTVINAARDGTLSQNFAFSTLIDVKARYKGVRIENNTIKDTNATPYVGVIYREDSAPSDSTNGESQKTSPGLDFTDTAKGNNKIELATDKYEVVQSPARVRIQKKTLAR